MFRDLFIFWPSLGSGELLISLKAFTVWKFIFGSNNEGKEEWSQKLLQWGKKIHIFLRQHKHHQIHQEFLDFGGSFWEKEVGMRAAVLPVF